MTLPTGSDETDATGGASAVPAGANGGPAAPLIGYALRSAHMVVMEDFNQTIVAGGIRALHYAVLTVVSREPGVRSSQLSHELRIKHTNLVPLLDELQGRSLIERRSIPQDRRARGLYLTESGATLMAALLPLVAAHERRFAARIGTDGKYTLIGLLHRLSDGAFDPPTGSEPAI
jgi:DNA-binding MarR family transcriptional regulator